MSKEMATKLVYLHSEVLQWCGPASLFGLLGINLFFTDHPRLTPRHKRGIQTVSMLLFIVAMVLMGVGLGIRRTEKEALAHTVAQQIVQLNAQKQQPTLNAAAIVGGISMAVVVLGAGVSARRWQKKERLSLPGSLLYSVGWLGAAVAASMQTRGLNSIHPIRAAYAFTGWALITLGSLGLPIAAHQIYVASPAIACIATGLTLFTVGNAGVTKPM